jgi:hypothetical protein
MKLAFSNSVFLALLLGGVPDMASAQQPTTDLCAAFTCGPAAANKREICHNKEQTLCIAVPAVVAHFDEHADDECGPCPDVPTAGGGGDPHFKLWNKNRISYHGEGDFVLIRSDDYANDLGLEVQIRTTIRKFYSFIEVAALRIGDEVLEVSRDYALLNGKRLEKDEFPSTIGGFVVGEPYMDGKVLNYVIDLENGDKIIFKVYNNFISVNVSGSGFESSVGMLGNHHTGAMLARDGETIIEDIDEYGAEWQVRDPETSLFQLAREPQYPMKPNMPTEESMTARRKLQSDNSMKILAEEACEHKNSEDFDFCVFDVMATNDVGMAGAW